MNYNLTNGLGYQMNQGFYNMNQYQYSNLYNQQNNLNSPQTSQFFYNYPNQNQNQNYNQPYLMNAGNQNYFQNQNNRDFNNIFNNQNLGVIYKNIAQGAMLSSNSQLYYNQNYIPQTGGGMIGMNIQKANIPFQQPIGYGQIPLFVVPEINKPFYIPQPEEKNIHFRIRIQAKLMHQMLKEISIIQRILAQIPATVKNIQ